MLALASYQPYTLSQSCMRIGKGMGTPHRSRNLVVGKEEWQVLTAMALRAVAINAATTLPNPCQISRPIGIPFSCIEICTAIFPAGFGGKGVDYM